MARMLLSRARPDLALREATEIPDVAPDRVVLPVELVVRESA